MAAAVPESQVKLRRFQRNTSTLLATLTRVIDGLDLSPPDGDLPDREQQTEILDDLASHLVDTGLALRRVVQHRQQLEEAARQALCARRLEARWVKPPALRVDVVPAAPAPRPPELGMLPQAEPHAEPPREAPPPEPAAPPEAAPPPPPLPTTALYTFTRPWEPRPERELIAEMERDVLPLLPGLEPADSHYELIRYKKLLVRVRRAYQECTEGHRLVLDQVSQAWKAVNALACEKLPDRRIPLLKKHVAPFDPAWWATLLPAYDDLAAALDAFTWYQIHRGDLRGREGKEMLDGIAAIQNQFFLHVDRELGRPGQDDQQQTLFRQLLEVQRETGMLFRPLNDRLKDPELQALADDMSSHYFATRQRVEYRRLQTEQLAQVLGILEIKDFCHDPKRKQQDAQQLRDALANALALGVSPTTRELRDALLPWVSILAGDERLEKVVSAIEVEIERRSQAPAEYDTKDTLDRALMEKLSQVRACVEGKKVLILGGEPMAAPAIPRWAVRQAPCPTEPAPLDLVDERAVRRLTTGLP